MQETGIVLNIQKFSLHDGPGIRTAVFLKGCPLRCLWCANPESQSPLIQRGKGVTYGEVKTAEEVMAVVRQDLPFYSKSGGGMTLTGGEPLLQPDFCLDLLRLAGEEGIHRAVETAGGVPYSRFEQVAPLTDLFLYDLKHHDAKKHLENTGAPLAGILENLGRLLSSGAEVIVRIPVIPGFNDAAEDARRLSGLLSGLGAKRVDLLPFHQFGERKYALLDLPYAMAGVRALYPEDLREYREAFLSAGILCGV